MVKRIRTVFLFVILALISIGPAWAAPLSSAEESLILAFHHARIIDAIRVDIERFAVYQKGNRGFWEERIGQDLEVLRLSRAGIAETPLLDELPLLRASFLSAVNALEGYAAAFLDAGPNDVAKADELLARRYERFREKLEAAMAAVVVPLKLAENFDPLDEEFKAFPDEDGREQFQKAAFLLEEKRFGVALEQLSKLREKYRGTPAEGGIVLRMVRCVLKDHAATVPADQEKAQIKLLEELLSSRVYYPNIYDIYVEWRTLYQRFYYGAARDVEIPNLDYLKKSGEVVVTLKQRVEAAPGDGWARSQLWMLVRLAVIGRSSGVSSGANGDLLGIE